MDGTCWKLTSWPKTSKTVRGKSKSSIYLFSANNANTRKACEIFLKLTINTTEWCHWGSFGVYIFHQINI